MRNIDDARPNMLEDGNFLRNDISTLGLTIPQMAASSPLLMTGKAKLMVTF